MSDALRKKTAYGMLREIIDAKNKELEELDNYIQNEPTVVHNQVERDRIINRYMQRETIKDPKLQRSLGAVQARLRDGEKRLKDIEAGKDSTIEQKRTQIKGVTQFLAFLTEIESEVKEKCDGYTSEDDKPAMEGEAEWSTEPDVETRPEAGTTSKE